MEYLGQHASGVVKALIAGPSDHDNMKDIQKHLQMDPTPADTDAGVTSMASIDSEKCKAWAAANVQETMNLHKEGWKFLQQ